jgi:hypothetical protein
MMARPGSPHVCASTAGIIRASRVAASGSRWSDYLRLPSNHPLLGRRQTDDPTVLAIEFVRVAGSEEDLLDPLQAGMRDAHDGAEHRCLETEIQRGAYTLGC